MQKNLKYFQVIAKFNNMTKAGETLHISQPALSKALGQLEEELGVPLFDRKGRNIYLNSFGKVFLQYVNKSMSELEAGQRIVKEMAGVEKGYISVAATFPHTFPKLIHDFILEHPNVRIRQVQSTSDEMQQLLKNRDIDFGISSYPIEDSDIAWKHLADDQIYLTVDVNHPLAARKIIDGKDFKDESFIGLTQGYGFRDFTDRLCQNEGFRPQHKIELEESTTILKLVKAGIGVSFTPGLSLSSDHSGLVMIPVNSPTFYRPIGVSYYKDHFRSLASEAFLEYTIAFFEDYSQGKGMGQITR